MGSNGGSCNLACSESATVRTPFQTTSQRITLFHLSTHPALITCNTDQFSDFSLIFAGTRTNFTGRVGLFRPMIDTEHASATTTTTPIDPTRASQIIYPSIRISPLNYKYF